MNVQKTETIKIRMDSNTLEMMEKARAFLKLDKSKFVRQSIRHMAEVVIADHEQTKFTEKDWERFFDLLDNPPQPTTRLRKAAKRFQEITAKNAI